MRKIEKHAIKTLPKKVKMLLLVCHIIKGNFIGCTPWYKTEIKKTKRDVDNGILTDS